MKLGGRTEKFRKQDLISERRNNLKRTVGVCNNGPFCGRIPGVGQITRVRRAEFVMKLTAEVTKTLAVRPQSFRQTSGRGGGRESPRKAVTRGL